VNNVGVVVPYPLLVTEMTETQIWEHVNVNMAATTLMTRVLLPGMLLRGRGIIVNLSSLSAVAPTPYLNVYASTKVSFTLAPYTLITVDTFLDTQNCLSNLRVTDYIFSIKFTVA
jgi:17beta-estradiol 17-dehydrogenase / very-long-chain 3-oxoacyl-CoA reductase